MLLAQLVDNFTLTLFEAKTIQKLFTSFLQLDQYCKPALYPTDSMVCFAMDVNPGKRPVFLPPRPITRHYLLVSEQHMRQAHGTLKVSCVIEVPLAVAVLVIRRLLDGQLLCICR